MAKPSAPGADRGAPVVLAFETAGAACSVAVGRGDFLLAHERREMRHGHGEALLPMIAGAMREAGLPPAAIDIVAVSLGPGGFTGIRIGIAAAQGLALAARARLIGVSSFAAVAAGVAVKSPLLIVLDSRRADLYVQAFDAHGNPSAAAAAVLPEDLSRYLAAIIPAGRRLIAGDAAKSTAAMLGKAAYLAVVPGSAPDALGVLAAALRRWRLGEIDDAARPLYLRPPDVSAPKTRDATREPAA